MKRIIFSACAIIAMCLLAACSRSISTPGNGVVATPITSATATLAVTATATDTPTAVATATNTPKPQPTSVPIKPTAVPPTATPAPTSPNVSGTWTAYGPSILTGTGNDCYRLVLIQAANSTNVVGSFGENSGTCPQSYLAVAGTFNGSQLLMKDVLPSSAQARLTFTIPAQPHAPQSSCGTTTIALTDYTSSLMIGTVSNCTVVSLQFQR